MSSSSYVKAKIKTEESQLIEDDKQMTRIAEYPLPSGYRPDPDFS